jgi:hypothetical protein
MSSQPTKYPRTYHLPWSLGITSDDKVMRNLDRLRGQAVVVTEKMDGENTTLYRDIFHARSLDSRHHPSRDWVKGLWGRIRHDIPEGWRVCVENLYAQHSIAYTSLESYTYGISVWDSNNYCLSWEATRFRFGYFGIPVAPVLYEGVFDETIVKRLYDEKRDGKTKEGYVVRLKDSFHYSEFSECAGKFVRSSHVQTDKHWSTGPVVPNKLAQGKG